MRELLTSLGVIILLFSALTMMTGRLFGQSTTIMTLPRWLLRKGLRGITSSARQMSRTCSCLTNYLWRFHHPNRGLEVAAWIIAPLPFLAALFFAALASLAPSRRP